MEPRSVTEIRLLGGHPVLDFVNTVDARRDSWGPDALAAYGDLVNWAQHAGIIDRALGEQLLRLRAADAVRASAALDRAKEARELLYAVFLAEARGTAVEPTTGAALGAFVADALARRTLVLEPHGFAWRWMESDLETILHRLVFAGAELLADRGDRRGVRECLGANCGWLFLDHSRGGRRRWCSDETCGTRSRVERFRARTAKDVTKA